MVLRLEVKLCTFVYIFECLYFLNVLYFKTIWLIMHDVFNNVKPLKCTLYSIM